MQTHLKAKLKPFAVVVGAIASMATSQAESGDRANGGDGDCYFDCGDDNPGPSCPAGEECSDLTPNGLFFTGMATGDVGPLEGQWAHPTAVGGEQTIGIFLDRDATTPLNLAFSAQLDSSALSIIDEGAASVRLAGVATGTPKLRITEPDSELLYDRITVEAEQVARMQLVPAGQYLFGDLDLREGESPFVVLTGRAVRVTAQLLTFADRRVVDESMTFDLSSSLETDPLGFADTAAVTANTAGTVPVMVRSGDLVANMSVTAVDAAERIESAWGDTQLQAYVGQDSRHCFQAMAGEAAVLGASWVYTGGPGLTLAQADDDVAEGCIQITGSEAGESLLTVEGAGVSAEFDVQIGDNSASAAPRPERAESGLAGDRADR